MTDAAAKSAKAEKPAFGFAELVAFTAALMALNPLAIDIMLPALTEIGVELNVAHENDPQLVIVVYLLATGVAQLFYGPLADHYGRRPVLLFALGGYLIGAALCVVATSFSFLLAARILQGFMTAAARVVAVAVVRDLYSGRKMASVMSLAMTIFMVAPIIAPGLGQLILFFAPWRAVFFALLVYGFVMFVWALWRMPESKKAEDRQPLNVKGIAKCYWQVVKTPVTFGYTIASSFFWGGLFAFITVSERLLGEEFNLGDAFPLAFAGIALALAASNFVNSQLVEKFGMRRLSHGAITVFTGINVIHLLVALAGYESFTVFMVFMSATFFTIGLVGANFNAIAMEPLGKIAGTAAGAYGFATTTIAALLGGLIGRQYDGSSTSLLVGLTLLGFCSILTVFITEGGRMFHTGAANAPAKDGAPPEKKYADEDASTNQSS